MDAASPSRVGVTARRLRRGVGPHRAGGDQRRRRFDSSGGLARGANRRPWVEHCVAGNDRTSLRRSRRLRIGIGVSELRCESKALRSMTRFASAEYVRMRRSQDGLRNGNAARGCLRPALASPFVTGLRIATEAPDRQWLNLLDAVLPYENVWAPHMQAALVLVALSIAYAVYSFRSGLSARVRLDQVRVRGLFGKGQVRLRALNTVLSWALFVDARVAAGQRRAALFRHCLPAWRCQPRALDRDLGAAGSCCLVTCVAHAGLGGLRAARCASSARRGSRSPPPQLDAGELLAIAGRAVGASRGSCARRNACARTRLQPEHAAGSSPASSGNPGPSIRSGGAARRRRSSQSAGCGGRRCHHRRFA